eukprot:m.36985 g.36985  ORF g.36985 m.36985 type:complete len:346 (+) comp7631_c0_seq2:1415-2452(+)
MGMFSAMPAPERCVPVPCGAGHSGAPDCQACNRGRTPGLNCSCDRSEATCTELMQQAAGVAQRPTFLEVPFISPAQNDSVTCGLGPAAAGFGGVGSKEGSALQLSCLPGTGALEVEFASFGHPVVNGAGRWIKLAGNSTPSTYWEDPAKKTVWAVIENNDCTACLSAAPRCTPVAVDPSYLDSVTVAIDPFSCAVLRNCEAFAVNTSCDAGPAVLTRAKELCDGKQSCRFPLDDPVLVRPSGCPEHHLLAIRAGGCAAGTGSMFFNGFRESLAGFLIARGPHAWFGHGWIAAAHPEWFPEWNVDYGVPLEPAAVQNGSVFSRQWSNFTVALDCASFEATFSPTRL